MPRTFRHSLLVALVLGFVSASVLSTLPHLSPEPGRTPAAAQDSLYKRLGGYDALAAVTDDFLGRLSLTQREPLLCGPEYRFQDQSPSTRSGFLCVATGGPCKYTGRDMETAHTGLNITEDDWTIASRPWATP